MRDGGKGDMQRPLGVDLEQFDNNWDAIFKKAKHLTKHIDLVNEEFNQAYEEYSKEKK